VRLLNSIPPAAVLLVLFVVALALLFYALWPYARRRFPPVLLLTIAGVLLGQGWDALGLPALHLGAANLVPAVLFAAALQPLADRLPELPVRFR
jgi:Kef-type K+ transport system membrane component KefB